ncbi:alpha/beta hydrolase [Cytophaga hutchinsonii]|uniref:Acetyl esterase/ sugar hydrolase n=1 Tax=Cytophaga hutchinsonii (strain ATCC 33406 / DSM 1761 / CIP 103989 / NBRC 15051 / NCIMB 9469 / D465) TaxID=269798 RepID=A0A6N4SRX0_CYTH3|nr:alpha/beta hydrolase [Cytophaga hutchinsonii]ABG59140.1 acetyl esterase/ sugar hydrolase [Cytophaga hutchinsonii ATCC 33406]SFX35785.1 alpha/beta hydrolase fold [Cytophaga hutchinsonii ATCC 33406]
MKNKIECLLLSFLLLIILSCTKNYSKQEETPKPTESKANLRVSNAVIYEGNYKNNDSLDNTFFIRYYPDAQTKRPLIIAIHGGGFTQRDKTDYNLPATAQLINSNQSVNVLTAADLDNNGFAYASINYTLLADGKNVTVKQCLQDGKTFFDYIRTHADEYNIDKNKIILLGDSGGAEISLWIGLQSEKNGGAVKGIVALNPQASMNILKWNDEVFAPYNASDVLLNQYIEWGQTKVDKRLLRMYGTKDNAQINAYSLENKLHLLDLIDSSDPELYMACGAPRKDAVHAPYHILALKQKSQNRGHSAKINFIDGNPPYYSTYWNPSPETVIHFCVRKCQ